MLHFFRRCNLPWFQATDLRLNEHYVRWYSCIINSIVMIVIPTFVLIYTTYQVKKLLNTPPPEGLSDERSKARAKRNKSITRMLIGIIVMFLICHTGKVKILKILLTLYAFSTHNFIKTIIYNYIHILHSVSWGLNSCKSISTNRFST